MKQPNATQLPARGLSPQQPGSAPPPDQKKSQAWIWILGGCLGIVVLAILAMVLLGWWGARKVKKELEKYTPNIEELKENTEKWQKKSEEFRENLPNPEDFPNPEDYRSEYPEAQ